MERLEKSQMKLEGRVERIDEEHLPRIAYEHQEKWRRRGRQRLRWFDSINRETQEA